VPPGLWLCSFVVVIVVVAVVVVVIVVVVDVFISGKAQ
jgi:hypothetical protein